MRTSLCLPYPALTPGSKKTTPLGQSCGTVQLEFLPTVEGTLLIEMVVD